jgi:alpha/beta hydrolase fold
MTERAEQDPFSTPAMLRQFASDYLAGADPHTPLASPLFASLSGLPPLLVQVGTPDLLLSDSERLATKATEAGVDVTLQIGEGLPHDCQILLGTPEAAEATEQIGQFLRAGTPTRQFIASVAAIVPQSGGSKARRGQRRVDVACGHCAAEVTLDRLVPHYGGRGPSGPRSAITLESANTDPERVDLPDAAPIRSQTQDRKEDCTSSG